MLPHVTTKATSKYIPGKACSDVELGRKRGEGGGRRQRSSKAGICQLLLNNRTVRIEKEQVGYLGIARIVAHSP